MKKTPYVLLSILFLFSPALARGAEISAVSERKNFISGEKFQVDIILDTEGESLNAFSGNISFPKKLLSLSEVRDGNSIVSFWIEKLKKTSSINADSESTVAFSGITPGGYVGNRGLIISLVFTSEESGSGTIYVRNAETLRNDGKGTTVKVSDKNFSFNIGKEKGSIPTFPDVIDTDPPENFKPAIAKDPNIFDGKWFAVFATSDKGSGIDRYEVAEKKGEWATAESPYLLKNQNQPADLYVKAVDKFGNERIAVIHTTPWLGYTALVLLAILIVIFGFRYRAKRARLHE